MDVLTFDKFDGQVKDTLIPMSQASTRDVLSKKISRYLIIQILHDGTMKNPEALKETEGYEAGHKNREPGDSRVERSKVSKVVKNVE